MNKFINIILILGLVASAFAQDNSTTTTTTTTNNNTTTPTGTVTPSPTPIATSTPSPSPTPSPLATAGYVTRTDYQDSSCTTQLRTATFAINKCSTGYLYPVYYNDGRQNAISISFFNVSGCPANDLVVHSDFQEGECIPGTPLSIKYTYSSTLPTITSGLYTFTQFDSNATACSGSLLAVTQLQGICYLKPFGNYQSEKIVCSGTTSYTTTSCTDTACTQGCVTRVTAVADAGCSKYDHTYNSCSAAPGSYPPVPTTPGGGAGNAFGGSGEAIGTTAAAGNTGNNGNNANGNAGSAGSQEGQGNTQQQAGSKFASCAGWGSTLSIVAFMAGAIVVLL